MGEQRVAITHHREDLATDLLGRLVTVYEGYSTVGSGWCRAATITGDGLRLVLEVVDGQARDFGVMDPREPAKVGDLVAVASRDYPPRVTFSLTRHPAGVDAATPCQESQAAVLANRQAIRDFLHARDGETAYEAARRVGGKLAAIREAAAEQVAYDGFPEGISDDYCEHAAHNTSQYGTTANALAAELLRLRKAARS